MEQNIIEEKHKLTTEFKTFFTTDKKMKMLVAYLIINLIYILIGSYIFFTGKIVENFQYKEFSIGLRWLLISNLIVFLAIFINKKKHKKLSDFKKPIYLGILLCVIFGIISTIFAIDKNIALEGYINRYEGLYTILYYLTLTLLSTFVSNKYKKALVNTILICGAIQAIYAICQSYNLFNVKQVLHVYKYYDESAKTLLYGSYPWIVGFTNNPNFLGVYMLICLSYSLGLVVDSKKFKTTIIYSILSALFMFVLLLTNTTSCAIGLIFVCIFMLIYVIKNKLLKKMLPVTIIIISITCITVQMGKTEMLQDVIKVGNDAVEVAKGNLDDDLGTKRMYIWKETFKIVPNYFLNGAGIDNFAKAFNGKALTRKVENKTLLYDKAHSEYLQILVTQGIFALASYLFIYGYTLFRGIKNSFKFKEIYLVLPIIGYLVQAFFNISVIEVTPIFYMALGLCCGKEQNL